jgi:hypothetical protein
MHTTYFETYNLLTYNTPFPHNVFSIVTVFILLACFPSESSASTTITLPGTSGSDECHQVKQTEKYNHVHVNRHGDWFVFDGVEFGMSSS